MLSLSIKCELITFHNLFQFGIVLVVIHDARRGKGTNLVLWKFAYEKARRLTNLKYPNRVNITYPSPCIGSGSPITQVEKSALSLHSFNARCFISLTVSHNSIKFASHKPASSKWVGTMSLPSRIRWFKLVLIFFALLELISMILERADFWILLENPTLNGTCL